MQLAGSPGFQRSERQRGLSILVTRRVAFQATTSQSRGAKRTQCVRNFPRAGLQWWVGFSRPRRGFLWRFIEFRTHCVRNCHEAWVFEIKLPKCLQVPARESLAKVSLETMGQVLDQLLSISSPPSTSLFLLDNLPPDKPVCHDLRRVDRPRNPGPRRFENPPDPVVQGCRRPGSRDPGHGRRVPPHRFKGRGRFDRLPKTPEPLAASPCGLRSPARPHAHPALPH